MRGPFGLDLEDFERPNNYLDKDYLGEDNVYKTKRGVPFPRGTVPLGKKGGSHTLRQTEGGKKPID
ncbi:hypothetical protein K1720_10455 [Thermococcus argininiproducens]|uniref:Uncharacterized protein n=1 Tax=Thermococcus argininiproducens TaxID=2866384 RepID=A0A9E7MA59_9EURY|nr:hypothetical protein [Thermococcus argininiproducens]USG99885.1 hypothetical protein K1720_10455 [Thermococcus argininiproducens]